MSLPPPVAQSPTGLQPLRLLAAKSVAQQLATLPPSQLLSYAQSLYQQVMAGPTHQEIYAARMVREELLRRLLIGWKIGILYTATTGQVERATVLLDDPSLTRNWRTARFGYYKRDQVFLEQTGLALGRLQGRDLPRENAMAIGSVLLTAYSQGQGQVFLEVDVTPGEVIADQQVPSLSRTQQFHIVGVNGQAFLPGPRGASNRLRIQAELDITPEALPLLRVLDQMNADPRFEWA